MLCPSTDCISFNWKFYSYELLIIEIIEIPLWLLHPTGEHRGLHRHLVD